MQRTLELQKKQLIRPPSFLAENIQYEVLCGSVSYGCSTNTSDEDIVGFTIPTKELLFPYTFGGEIEGFGKQKQRFEQYQQHHIKDINAEKQYDITIYSIVRYFHLCMENNPNMVDTLYVPQNCVLHCSRIGKMVRDKRDLFLHKGSYHKFVGYSFAQKSKMTNLKENSHRAEDVKLRGYDTKNASHLVRLLYECEMILQEHTLDLQRYKEHLKAIRRGEVSLEDINKFYSDKESSLRKLYEQSSLRHSPDEQAIKQLLLDCLEEHYGSLAAVIVLPDKYKFIVDKIKELVNVS